MISSAEIARLAHHNGIGDRILEKDYVLSWLLVAIAESKLRSSLAFKGGTALKHCYYPNYRFSEDLDFTLIENRSHDDLILAFTKLFHELIQRINLSLTLARAEQSVHQSTTLLINYVGPLRARSAIRNLKVDITRGEKLQYSLNERPLYASYSDIPPGVTLPTYALEEVLIEKLVALISRTEPRDLYDVYWLLEQGDVDLVFIQANFDAKCRHKGQDPNRFEVALSKKERSFNKLWDLRLAVQVPDLPHLDEVMRAVRRHSRYLDLI